MADIPFITVPLSAHDHRVLNWLIRQINTQQAGGTPVAYTLYPMMGGSPVGASPFGGGQPPAGGPRTGPEPQQAQAETEQHEAQTSQNNAPSRRR